ncbi:MAG: hypothetical protein D8M59_04335 [Planctomycetes bacterium]|nr:hypothetical protein [Planctomycetota bacterium]NOG55736.1 hypothetical protein [Planctomycetota bacterium]
MSMVNSVNSAYSSMNRLISAAGGNRPAPVRLSNPVTARAQQVDAQDTVEIQSRQSAGPHGLDVTEHATAATTSAASTYVPVPVPVRLPASVHRSSPVGQYASSMSMGTQARSPHGTESGARLNVLA